MLNSKPPWNALRPGTSEWCCRSSSPIAAFGNGAGYPSLSETRSVSSAIRTARSRVAGVETIGVPRFATSGASPQWSR